MTSSILKERAVLKVSGPEAENFLQNLCTNNIGSGDFMYSLILTPQGKVLYDIFIWRDADAFLLDHPKNQGVLEKLNSYKLRSKILVELQDSLQVIVSTANNGQTDPRDERLGTRQISSIHQTFNEDSEWYHQRRFSYLVPECGYDFEPAEFFPSDLGLIKGISTNKGCYVGQEVTNRILRQGVIRKALYRLQLTQSDVAIPKRTIALLSDETIGKVLSRKYFCQSQAHVFAILQKEALISCSDKTILKIMNESTQICTAFLEF